MQRAQAIPIQEAVDDLAPVNRFYVTVDPVTREKIGNGVEILRQHEYNLCWPVVAMKSEDAGFATVTGYSFRGYESALENALRAASDHR